MKSTIIDFMFMLINQLYVKIELHQVMCREVKDFLKRRAGSHFLNDGAHLNDIIYKTYYSHKMLLYIISKYESINLTTNYLFLQF